MIDKFLNKITHADCMEVMKQLPDKSIELLLTDPPYGEKMARRGCLGSTRRAAVKDYGVSDWDDEIPSKEYFDEMFRVSKNQIIFGGNFMSANIGRNSNCWIVWDKDNTGNYADCELAYTSFNRAVKKYTYRWNGMIQQDMKNKEIRIHPTQKPVRLFEMILRDFYFKRESEKKNDFSFPNERETNLVYNKESNGGIVADFYSGSGSVAIACYNLAIPFISVEKRFEHYRDSVQRLKDIQAQMKLFRGI